MAQEKLRLFQRLRRTRIYDPYMHKRIPKRLNWEQIEARPQKEGKRVVKGTSKRIVVVKSPDPKVFEEAIFIVKEDFLGFAPALRPIGGYRQKVLRADGGRTVLIYLQNCRPYSHLTDDGRGGKVEQFSLRDRVPVPVRIAGLDPSSRVRLYDLDTRKFSTLDPAAETGLGVTDHDFVLICEKDGAL